MNLCKRAVLILTSVVAVLVAGVSAMGIALEDGGQPRTVHSPRGASVTVHGGQSLYRHDTLDKARIGRAFDWANLLVGLPLLVLGLWLYKRQAASGPYLLGGALFHFFYNYLQGAMGLAYNPLFLAYVIIYSASLFGLILVAAGLRQPPAALLARLPRRLMGGTLLALATTFAALWLGVNIHALVSGAPPAELGLYTTIEAHAIDLGLYVPLAVLGTVLLWRRHRWGPFVSVALLMTACLTFIPLAGAEVVRVAAQGWRPDALASFMWGAALSLLAIGAVVMFRLYSGLRLNT